MGILDTGGVHLAKRMMGDNTLTDFNESNSYIRVGNGTTAFARTQTDLLGASTYVQGMDTGFPERVDNVTKYRATIGGAYANFAWTEIMLANAETDGTAMNRMVGNFGIKELGQTWVVVVEFTF